MRISLGALWISMALLLTSCAPQRTQSSSTATPRRTPTPAPTLGPVTVKAVGDAKEPVSIVVTGHGRKLYTVDADANDLTRASSGAYSSHFMHPRIVFYQQDGGRMRATARTADVDGASKIVTMQDDVHLVTQDQTQLTCDHLVYDQRSGRVHGTGHVHVHTVHGDTLQGQVIDGDVQLRQVHVYGSLAGD